MKRLVFALGVLALGVAAATPARADFAVVKFRSDYCRVWDNTAMKPPDGMWIWYHAKWHKHWISFYKFRTRGAAVAHMEWSVRRKMCHHWRP